MQTKSTPNHSGLIPCNSQQATDRLNQVQIPRTRLKTLPKEDFLRGWNALLYLHTGLHPDESANPEGGWPAHLLPLAEEAWRRVDGGELSEEEIYCSGATWAGLCDQIENPTAEEKALRRELATR